jgi:hypothetical protein
MVPVAQLSPDLQPQRPQKPRLCPAVLSQVFPAMATLRNGLSPGAATAARRPASGLALGLGLGLGLGLQPEPFWVARGRAFPGPPLAAACPARAALRCDPRGARLPCPGSTRDRPLRACRALRAREVPRDHKDRVARPRGAPATAVTTMPAIPYGEAAALHALAGTWRRDPTASRVASVPCIDDTGSRSCCGSSPISG